jgi:hypothetical protein
MMQMGRVIKIPISLQPPSLKESLVVLYPTVGINNEYGDPVEYNIANNEAVITIDVAFDGVSGGEVQTLELTIVFDDGAQDSREYTCTSDQFTCKYTLTPSDILLYMPPTTYTSVNVFQRKIVKIVARAKTSLSEAYGIPYVTLHLLRI